MGTLLYLTSNAIHVYAVSIFFDVFLGKSKINHKLKSAAYVAYYIVGSLCWIIVHNETLNIFINIMISFIITMQYNT